ncbi:MAG: hypothetical protein AABX28_02045 [Nanoarchaeota archaeon]
MENKKYDLRNPYNLASLKAIRMMEVRETDQVDKALYGVYCEALEAVKRAIKNGAQVSDLEKAINELGASEHRIIRE